MPDPSDPTTWDVARLHGALAAQWQAAAAGAAGVDDWDAPTRLKGWTARTLLGHLVIVAEAIPATLRLAPTTDEPVTVYQVFTGAPGRAASNDERARQAAAAGDPGALVDRLQAAAADLAGGVTVPDRSLTLPTRLAPMAVPDFLVHRAVEGVVHGLDLPVPVDPDAGALEVAAAALVTLLAMRSPEAVAAVPGDRRLWVEAATGRIPPPSAALAAVLPVLS